MLLLNLLLIDLLFMILFIFEFERTKKLPEKRNLIYNVDKHISKYRF